MRKFKPVHIGHLDICQNNIRRALLGKLERLDSVVRLARHGKTQAFPVYGLPYCTDYIFLIVHQHAGIEHGLSSHSKNRSFRCGFSIAYAG